MNTPDKITLKLRHNYGPIDFYNSTPETPFSDLWDYVSNKIKDLDALKFNDVILHDGLEKEMGQTIGELGMKNNSEVMILVSQPEGFGMPIVDLSALDKAQLIEIKKEGKARLKIQRGLSLKGKCQNKNCDCFNKNVAQAFGYGVFCMLITKNEFKCPMCQEKVEGNYSVYFVKCKYRVSGEYINEQKKKVKVPKLDFEIIDGNKSKVYTPDEAGTRNWTRLDIEVEPLDNPY